MDYGVRSDVGKVRTINQDSYLALDGDIKIFAVADGMGGHKAGEVASAMAIETIRQYQGQREDIRQMLKDIIMDAHKRIYERQLNDPACQGMGTTLTIAVIKENLLYIGHVGDSRVYLYRDQDLLQITTDHSLVNELLKNDQISEEEAKNHPHKHILLQALGSGNELNVEINCFSLERSDIILLCTDGLNNMLTKEEIIQILKGEGSLQEKSELLVEAANNKGGLDNITVILFKA
ncbi:hypothetical protein BBF96_05855 [Anoxybacter fermentans]|uniref:PPM-type phosphatase domain-containing protein n=1 Tax=Anoxybacter fermentans TaxID=1323375 RepID=A0A3Q9HQ84_9FIRM|nr:Stp1/IreP family PP2C-type Ser/Thr phosphatase [Anoxybacter fermentans]AZR72959.1 hypothetical protein BBF96_05855 [Anoxybacter fermentans]